MPRYTSYGIDYDQIAAVYDANPLCTRGPDPDLLNFAAEPANVGRRLAVLDLGRGTGIQLVVNRAAPRDGLLVGLDPFEGMLRVARASSRTTTWRTCRRCCARCGGRCGPGACWCSTILPRAKCRMPRSTAGFRPSGVTPSAPKWSKTIVGAIALCGHAARRGTSGPPAVAL
jgi:hypothetical protein